MDVLKKCIYDELGDWKKKKLVMDWMSDAIYALKMEPKDSRQSDLARVRGNKLYAENNLNLEHQHKIIRLYNESIGYAPIDSEDLAKTYANKSALLRQMRRYAECISEADNALRITKSIPLRIKLLCRKADCLTALGSSENRACLEKARFFMAKPEVSQEPEDVHKSLIELIEKTQTIVDKNKLSKPKVMKRILQSSKLIADAQEKDVWKNSVKVDYSKKDGWHLVAARDIEPGEIILLEKPYHSMLEHDGMYQYCYHCIKYLWTAVPCDQCNWRLYCSDKCKKDSWDQYHEMECGGASCVKERSGSKGSYFVMSLFFKTFKEAGSIRQLLADIKSMDQTEGQFVDDVTSDGGLTYKTICTFPVSILNLTKKQIKKYAIVSIGMLVWLGKLSKIFDRGHDFHDMSKLKNDPIAISIGAFLLKLNIMALDRAVTLRLVVPTEFDAYFSEYETSDERLYCSTLNLSTIMAVRGCIPNTIFNYTRELLCIWHSIQPIKEGDKLIYLDSNSTIYNYQPKMARLLTSRGSADYPCDCRACIENWPPEKLKTGLEVVIFNNQDVFNEMIGELNFFMAERQSKSPIFVNPDMRTMTRVENLLVRAWQNFALPSSIITKSIRIFWMTSGYFHGQSIHDFK